MAELSWPDSSHSHQLEENSIIFQRITQIHSGVSERDQDTLYFMRRRDSNPSCYAMCQRLLTCEGGCSRLSNKLVQDREIGMAAKSHVIIRNKTSEGFCETNLVHKFIILLTVSSGKNLLLALDTLFSAASLFIQSIRVQISYAQKQQQLCSS